MTKIQFSPSCESTLRFVSLWSFCLLESTHPVSLINNYNSKSSSHENEPTNITNIKISVCTNETFFRSIAINSKVNYSFEHHTTRCTNSSTSIVHPSSGVQDENRFFCLSTRALNLEHLISLIWNFGWSSFHSKRLTLRILIL